MYIALYHDLDSRSHMNIFVKNYLTVVSIHRGLNHGTIKKQVFILHLLKKEDQIMKCMANKKMAIHTM